MARHTNNRELLSFYNIIGRTSLSNVKDELLATRTAKEEKETV